MKFEVLVWFLGHWFGHITAPLTFIHTLGCRRDGFVDVDCSVVECFIAHEL